MLMDRILEVLKMYPKDVKVRIGSTGYGGVWRWNINTHELVPVERLKTIPNWLEYVQSLPLVQIDLPPRGEEFPK